MRALAVAVLLLLTVPAAADIPPPNQCDKVGDPCETAGNDYHSKGVCMKQSCSKTLPGPNGPETRTYDCNLCQLAPAAEKAMAEKAPATGDTKAPAATSPAPTKKACSVAVGGDGAGVGASLLVLAAALAATRRRRAG